MPELRCQHCGETLVAKRRDAKFCSKICYNAAYRDANLEKERERCRAKAIRYYYANPETSRKWRAANPDKVREANRRWRESNLEQERERSRLYREANLQKELERNRVKSRNYYQVNPEKCKASSLAAKNRAASARAIAHVASEILKLNGDQNDQSE